MRLLTIVLCLGVVAVLAGCVPDELAWPGSLYPLYSSEEEVVTEPALLGEWRDSSNGSQTVKWFFREGEKPGTYVMGKVESADDHATWKVRLVKSGDTLFLDALRVEDTASDNDGIFATRIALHQFVRLDEQGDRLRLSSLDEDWYLRQLELRQFPLKIERLGDNVPVITSPPAELRAFYTKAAAEPGAFSEIAELARPGAKLAQ